MTDLLIFLPDQEASEAALYRLVRGTLKAHSGSTLHQLHEAKTSATAIVVVPAHQLSWHRVQTPKVVRKHAGKLLATIKSQIDECSVGNTNDLHVALEPDWRGHDNAWVASCRAGWLAGHIHALRDRGFNIARIVPEVAPEAQTCARALQGLHKDVTWFCSHALGVWPVPNDTLSKQTSLAWVWGKQTPPTRLQVDAHTANILMPFNDVEVDLVTDAQRLEQLHTSQWDLAQWSLASSAWRQWTRAATRRISTLLRAPQWRVHRRALLALCAIQVVGLCSWSWVAQSNWQRQERQLVALFKQTFPDTPLVVDAYKQMKQRVTGASPSNALPAVNSVTHLLAATSKAWPANLAPANELSYGDQVLSIKGVTLNPQQMAGMLASLAEQGLVLRQTNDTLTVEASQ